MESKYYDIKSRCPSGLAWLIWTIVFFMLYGGGIAGLIIVKMAYLIGALFFFMILVVCIIPSIACLNCCDPDKRKHGFNNTDYMVKREKNMAKIMVEDFGKRRILTDSDGKQYIVSIGMYGAYIIVDRLSEYK